MKKFHPPMSGFLGYYGGFLRHHSPQTIMPMGIKNSNILATSLSENISDYYTTLFFRCKFPAPEPSQNFTDSANRLP